MRYERQAKYDKKFCKKTFRLHAVNDVDIVNFLKTQNTNELVKKLLRDEINRVTSQSRTRK